MAATSKLTSELMGALRARLAENSKLRNQTLAAEFSVDPKTIAKARARLKNEQAAAGGEPTLKEASGITEIPLDQIVRSTLNPRKTFDEQELANLAESIAASGLLQNLVVRPAYRGTDAVYELVAGERRYRALERLAAQNRWSGLVPCRIVLVNEGEHLALALLENLQRNTVPPLEEADAFAKLRSINPEVWTTGAIAEKIGRSQRYVQQRIQLSEQLVLPAKILLAAGAMTLDAARLLVGESEHLQRGALALFWAPLGEPEITLDQITPEMDLKDLGITSENHDWKTITAEEVAYKLSSAQIAAHERAAPDDAHSEPATDRPGPEKTKKQPEAFVSDAIKEKAAVAREKRNTEEAARIESLERVIKKLDTDFSGVLPRGVNCCADQCMHRVALAFWASGDFHVCSNPASPRAGLLTGARQGGGACFEEEV